MTELNACVVCGLVMVVGAFLFVLISRAGSQSPILYEDPLEEEVGYYLMMSEAEHRYENDGDE